MCASAKLTHLYFRLVVICTVLGLLVRFSFPNGANFRNLNRNIQEDSDDLMSSKVKTHKGLVSFNELEDKVYKPFGYGIKNATLPVPTLEMIAEPTCEKVFSEWLEISQEPQPPIPPKFISVARTNAFLLNGYAALGEYYFNDKTAEDKATPGLWDQIPEMMAYSKYTLGNMAYALDSVSLYYALDDYRLDGKNGFVVGSLKPWVEIMALHHGAKKVLTVEYNSITGIAPEFQDRLSSIVPTEFVKNWEIHVGTFDFAISFSSIEHSGLGRYGDPLDPIGDLREMLKIKCMLKRGGLFYLGLPFGMDSIQYNAHRIYGPIRLGMMLAGFEWLGTYNGTRDKNFDFDFKQINMDNFAQTQYTLVLRKL